MKQSRKTIPFFIIVILLAIILRTATISHESLWGDEAWTMKFASTSTGDLIHQAREDVHPPLYFLTIHYWINIFGTSEASLRFPSLLFSLISMYLFYRLCKRLNINPLPTTALFALSLSGLIYAQETRSYALIVLLTIWMIHSLIKLRQENKGLTELIIANTLLLYTHVFGMVAVLTAAAVLYFSFPKKEALSPTLLAAFIAPFILYLPWFIPFIKQMYHFLPLLTERLATNTHGIISPLIFYLLTVVGIILAILLVIYKHRHDEFSLLTYYQKIIIFCQQHILLFTAGWILFFSLAYHFFATTNPFVRYPLFLIPLIYLTLGFIIAHHERIARIFVIFSFILLAINVTHIDRYDWRNATNYALGFQDNKTLYGFEYAGTSYQLFDYYASKTTPSIQEQMVKLRYLEITPDEHGINREHEITLPPNQIDPLKRYVLIISKLRPGDQSQYEQILATTHLQTQSRNFKDVRIVVFEPKG